jgi:uncharacterized oxidoreductase
MKLSGNTILITGATSGIGLAFAEEFYSLGNKVIICGRRADRLHEIKTKYPDMSIKQCDVSNENERKDLIKWAIAEHPKLNVIINNAGVQTGQPINEALDLNKLRYEMEVNFNAPIHIASLAMAHLRSREQAAIINITSGLAFVPLAFMPIYCATKAALHSVTLSLRHQLKNTSIKVFEVAPPSVDTELGHERRINKNESHGGIPVKVFLAEAMEGLANDTLETIVGHAKSLRAKREDAFEFMNK